MKVTKEFHIELAGIPHSSVKCYRVVNSVPRRRLSLSGPILSIADQMIPPSRQEYSHGKTQYIPGKQVLVRSWLWKKKYSQPDTPLKPKMKLQLLVLWLHTEGTSYAVGSLGVVNNFELAIFLACCWSFDNLHEKGVVCMLCKVAIREKMISCHS